jgi:transcriptional regulator with XRE-family HTH domain
MYEIIETKRMALGLTQGEVAELAGISKSTVSNFEQGKEVSKPIYTCIRSVIDNQFKSLDKKEYMEATILMHALQLRYASDGEKSAILSYITLHSSKLQLELSK